MMFDFDHVYKVHWFLRIDQKTLTTMDYQLIIWTLLQNYRFQSKYFTFYKQQEQVVIKS